MIKNLKRKGNEMKKLVIAVAVIVGMEFGLVHAEVYFDGQKADAPKTVNFGIVNNTCENGNLISVPDPEKPAISTVSDVAGVTAHDDNKTAVAKLDWSIKFSIENSKKNNADLMQENLKKLLVYGTIEEKRSFVYGNEKKYTFPSRIVQGFAADSKSQWDLKHVSKGIPACISWGSKEVCVDRQDCKDVCVAGAVVCYAVTSIFAVVSTVCGPGAAVCTLTCVIKPECTNIPVCLEMGEVPGYGSGTPL